MDASELPVYKRIMELKEAVDSSEVLVGWIDRNGSARKAYENMQTRQRTGKPTPSLKIPPSNALIARTLNYGRLEGVTAEGRHYPEIPARPFMDVARENFDKVKDRIFRRYIPQLIAGTMSVDQFLAAIGSFYMDQVKVAMRDSSKYQELSQKTKDARRHRGNGDPIPLIDTHQLIDSVSFEVKR